MGCVSQDSHPRIGIKSSRQILQKARGTEKKKYGEERVHREASFRSVNLTSAIRAPPSLRRGHKTKPNKKDAPDEWHGTWRRVSTSSKKLQIKQRFTFLLKSGQRRRPLQHLQRNEQFVVDSGASMHMLSKKDWSSNKMETLLRSRNTTTVVTANGEVQTIEEIQVYVHDLELLVTVQVLEDTPAVLSHGKLWEEHGYTYEWASGQKAMADAKMGN